MTVNTSDITSGPYSGNDVTTEFSYDFRVDSKTQLIVYETDDLGVETVLTVDTNYTVAGIGNAAGGTITRVAGALPTGYTWYIRSNYQPTQLTSFPSQGGFFPAVHESAFDKITFLIQQILDRVNRSLRFRDGYSGNASAEIPDPVALRYLRWNSDASAIELSEGSAQALASQVVSDDGNVQTDIDGLQTDVSRRMVTFDSVAAMVAANYLQVGQKVRTLGYYTQGDGGGNDYEIVAAATGTDDGGSYIDLTGISGQAKGLFVDGVVNVNQFGAKANDLTFDSSSAFQASIDYLNTGAIGGGIANLLKGDYRIDSTITLYSGIGLKGKSRRATRVYSYITDSSVTIYRPLPSPDTAGSSYNKISLDSFTLIGYGSDGAGTGCGDGVYIADTNQVSIKNFTSTLFPDAAAGFIRAGAFNNVIEEAEFSNSKTCLDINGGSGTPNKITMVTLNNVECSGAVGGNSLSLNQCVMVTLNDCTIQDATHLAGSLSTTGQGARIVDCESVAFNDCWFERTEGANIYGLRVDHLIVRNGHYTSAGYTGGAVGTEDAAYPSIDLNDVSKAIITKPFFYERNGSHIDIDASCTFVTLDLIPARDDTDVSVTDPGAIAHVWQLQSTKQVSKNKILEAKEFRASNTNGFALPGGDGSDYQFRVDSNKKAFVRRNSSGIVKATGDMHYGGSTGSRPAAPYTYESFFDTTLGKPIWFDGVNWVDATGTTV